MPPARCHQPGVWPLWVSRGSAPCGPHPGLDTLQAMCALRVGEGRRQPWGPSPCPQDAHPVPGGFAWPWRLCCCCRVLYLAVGTLTLLWGPSSTRIHPDLAVETLIMLQGPSPTVGTLILPWGPSPTSGELCPATVTLVLLQGSSPGCGDPTLPWSPMGTLPHISPPDSPQMLGGTSRGQGPYAGLGQWVLGDLGARARLWDAREPAQLGADARPLELFFRDSVGAWHSPVSCRRAGIGSSSSPRSPRGPGRGWGWGCRRGWGAPCSLGSAPSPSEHPPGTSSPSPRPPFACPGGFCPR